MHFEWVCCAGNTCVSHTVYYTTALFSYLYPVSYITSMQVTVTSHKDRNKKESEFFYDYCDFTIIQIQINRGKCHNFCLMSAEDVDFNDDSKLKHC